jgi:hypothetical protein
MAWQSALGLTAVVCVASASGLDLSAHAEKVGVAAAVNPDAFSTAPISERAHLTEASAAISGAAA